MWGKDEEKLTDAGVMPTQKAAFKQLIKKGRGG